MDENIIENLPVAEPQEEKPKMRSDALKDLFEVPKENDNDIYCDDLVDLSDEDVYGGDTNLSDLTSVNTEDIMGNRPKKKRIQRTYKPYYPPDSMGGMR